MRTEERGTSYSLLVASVDLDRVVGDYDDHQG